MTTQEQQAREMAERCAARLADKGELYWAANSDRPDTYKDVTETILRELNLVSLLEDKARLERLEKEFIHAIANKSQPSLFYTTGPITFEGDDFRTAITNAMKQEEGK